MEDICQFTTSNLVKVMEATGLDEKCATDFMFWWLSLNVIFLFFFLYF